MNIFLLFALKMNQPLAAFGQSAQRLIAVGEKLTASKVYSFLVRRISSSFNSMLSWTFNLFLKLQNHCPKARLFPIHIISSYQLFLVWLQHHLYQIEELIANGNKEIVSSHLLSPYKPPNLFVANRIGFCAEVEALPQSNCRKQLLEDCKTSAQKPIQLKRFFSVFFLKKHNLFSSAPPPSLQ